MLRSRTFLTAAAAATAAAATLGSPVKHSGSTRFGTRFPSVSLLQQRAAMCMSAALPSPATADIMDHFQGQVQVAPSIGFRDYGGVRRFSGGITTVRCRENNPLVRQRLTKEAGGGRVLVVDGGGSTRCALLGDMLAAGAVQNGWAGVIIHGCIRDSAAIAQLPLGVKAVGTNPTKSGKADPGEADVPVTFAGVTFTPGHWVYADEDGIVVSAMELALPAADNPAANASER